MIEPTTSAETRAAFDAAHAARGAAVRNFAQVLWRRFRRDASQTAAVALVQS
ncbi:MAG: hypothetical protein AAF386_00860 [Pseudomonadota bacterium]